jgi:hypothetical protein
VNLELVGTRTISQELLGVRWASRRIDIIFFSSVACFQHTTVDRLLGQKDHQLTLSLEYISIILVSQICDCLILIIQTTTRKCQDFALSLQVPRFLWLQRWSCCGSMSARLASVSRARGRSKTSGRSTDIDASMATHRPGKRYHPRIRYEVEPSKVQPIQRVDFRLELFYRELFTGIGKEGEGMGKLRKESSRNAPDFRRPTYNSPPLASRNLAQP